MKKLGKLRLSELSKDMLNARQQNVLKGGEECRCSCSPCVCQSWDGSGSMPIGQSGNDLGMGYVGGVSASTRGSYL